MRVDAPRAVDLAELALHRGEAQTHLGCLTVGQGLERPFVDGSCGGQPVVLGRFGDVDREQLKSEMSRLFRSGQVNVYLPRTCPRR